MPPKPETDLIRFRIERALKQQAAVVCERLGLDLIDALRLFVGYLAREGKLPFDLPPIQPEQVPAKPFAQYRDELFDLGEVDYEAAQTLLWRFIADRSAKLSDEKNDALPDNARLTKWRDELEEAKALSRSLLPTDKDAIARVLARYGRSLTAAMRPELYRIQE